MITELREALDRTAQIVAAVPDDRAGDPTPCPDFDVRALMNHLVAGNIMFAGVANGGAVDMEVFDRDNLAEDPAGAYRQSAEMALAAWQRPGALDESLAFAGMPGSVVIRMHLTEELVHGWDLAVATDQEAGIDDELAELALEVLRPVPEEMLRGPQSFGPAVEVPDDAPTGDALVAFLGRDPAAPIAKS
jgi:uncharacterized protein (TIGR03086 family)